MERRGKQGRYGNDGASIRSSLFCSYIWLHILLSYLQWRPPPCRPGSSWYLSAARLSVCLSGCVCVCVCVPRQYFCGRHGNVRSPSVRGCFRRGWCIMSQGLLFSEGDVHRVDLSPPQSWSADWMYEALSFRCGEFDSAPPVCGGLSRHYREVCLSFDSPAPNWKALTLCLGCLNAHWHPYITFFLCLKEGEDRVGYMHTIIWLTVRI